MSENNNNIEKQYIENGYLKIFGSSYHSIYVNEDKDSAVLISNNTLVATTTYENLSYFDNKFKEQSLPIYMLTVRQSVIHSWVVLGNMEPFVLPGTTNDIKIFKNGYIISKDPVKDTLLFLSRPLLKGKDIQKVADHVFTFIDNNMIKYVNLLGVEEWIHNETIGPSLISHTHSVCTTVDNYEFSENKFMVYKPDGTRNIIEVE